VGNTNGLRWGILVTLDMVVKEYPSNQLPRRMRELDNWQQSNEEELTWYNDTFALFRIVASINTWEGRFSISYNAESR
jgi:hypothetical protein